MNNTFYDPHTYFLAHHGIVGQKWGKRNGPPYPLNAQTHNRVVRRSRKAGDMNTLVNLFAVTSPIATHIAATNNAKKKARQEAIDNRGNSIDRKSGLVKKSRAYSEEEDAKAVNPGYKYMTGDCQNNCMSCSVTYDTRRRGFEAISILSSKPVSVSLYEDIYPNRNERWYGSGMNTFFKNGTYNKDYFISDIKKNGDSRGIINVFWGFGAGHAMNYSVEDGEFKLIDSQSGKIYNEDKANKWMFNSASEMMFFRTDNFSDDDINYNELKKYID